MKILHFRNKDFKKDKIKKTLNISKYNQEITKLTKINNILNKSKFQVFEKKKRLIPVFHL